ncbi:hypothetical protein BDW75DRAFT_212118 [Aspergillus navahoensis]
MQHTGCGMLFVDAFLTADAASLLKTTFCFVDLLLRSGNPLLQILLMLAQLNIKGGNLSLKLTGVGASRGSAGTTMRMALTEGYKAIRLP